MEQSITFIGLDVHKETISIALASGCERSEARVYGEIANRPDALRKLLSRLSRDDHELRFCYAERDKRSAARAATGSSVS
jgi:hypothetical protein